MFVDYNQNARDHTIASAYSVRGVREGTVSTPIRWDEIDDVVPAELTIATVPERFAKLGDLHAGIDDVRVFRRIQRRVSALQNRSPRGLSAWRP